MIKIFELDALPSGVAEDIEDVLSAGGGTLSVLSAGKILEDNGIYPKWDRSGELCIPELDATVPFTVTECLLDWHLKLDIRPGRSKLGLKMAVAYERNAQRPKRDVARIEGFVMNVPEFFEDPEFVAWLESDSRKFTSHVPGQTPDDWTEVLVNLDTNLVEGGEAGMPQWCWEVITSEARNRLALNAGNVSYVIRLTNLKD